MQYKVEWLEPDRLLLITLEGIVTMPDYEEFSAERLRYLNDADGQIYCICDWSAVSDKISPPIFAALANTSAHHHPNCKVMAVVGNQAMLKMIATIIIQKPTTSDPAAAQVFESLEQAETFCRTVMSVDQNLATPSSVSDKPTNA
ncbi:MAG: STAS/SEC14 domain-containing protein [Chloroflexota bacterium]